MNSTLGQTCTVPFLKLSTTDAFVITDLDGADAATGVVRRAKKILPDGAKLLARSASYGWAVHGKRISGASAGINADDDAASGAVEAFGVELADRVANGSLSLIAAKGVTADGLANLYAVDRRMPLLDTQRETGTLADELLVVGAVVAAERALAAQGAGASLDGSTVTIEGAGTAGPALVLALAAAGAKVVCVATSAGTITDPEGFEPKELSERWKAEGEAVAAPVEAARGAAAIEVPADVLFCGSRTGMIDHTAAGALPHKVVVPIGPAPVTTRALAVAHRRNVVVLPDFVTTSGPLVAWDAPPESAADGCINDARQRIDELVAAALEHPENPTLGACSIAEEFLLTWQERLPFGRPMA